MAAQTELTAPYISRFADIAPGLPGVGLPWLAELRAGAIKDFAAAGFPTIRSEAWKYTDLRRMLRTEFTAAPEAAAEPDAGVLDGWCPQSLRWPRTAPLHSHRPSARSSCFNAR